MLRNFYITKLKDGTKMTFQYSFWSNGAVLVRCPTWFHQRLNV